MLGPIGPTEIIVILVVVLVLFGSKKLPEIGSGLGRAIRNFRKATTEPSEVDITPKAEKENARPTQADEPKA
ncbi:MAG: twin-arginine translocase TatA/TatE family subunit [Desulfovibrio sp.]|nr:twin-arginine translocase TatA/TatE family subunit [Desulfovibrio sp.]